MYLLRKLENWRVLSAIKQYPVRFSDWVFIRSIACIRNLTSVEKARLRVLMSVLLKQKIFVGEQGVFVTDEMKLIIAAQACVPVLKLGLNYYSDFVQINVYPAAFWVEHSEQDESGVMHRKKRLLSGESWQRGPVVLSWSDIEFDLKHDNEGHNVIIHEFAHKIDMLNQGANGVPLFPVDFNADEWGKVFRKAYHQLLKHQQHQKKSCINSYAATSPAEYFAVVSEYFFTMPLHLKQCSYPLYNELKLFYRQDPAHKSKS